MFLSILGVWLGARMIQMIRFDSEGKKGVRVSKCVPGNKLASRPIKAEVKQDTL